MQIAVSLYVYKISIHGSTHKLTNISMLLKFNKVTGNKNGELGTLNRKQF